jgi:hypothetical protein
MACCSDNTLEMMQNDTRPSLQLVLYDAQAGSPYDLSDVGTSAYFVIRPVAKAAKETILCQKLPGTVASDGTVTYPPQYSVPGSAGRVEVHWTSTALDTAGSFEGKIQIYWNDGTLETSYDTMAITVQPQWSGLPMAPEPVS